MLPSFIPVPNVSDATVRLVQAAVQRALKRVTQCPLLDGVLVPVTFAAAGVAQPVVHKLGRVPVGYLVASSTVPASVARTATSTDATAVSLTASAACAAVLWVF